MNKTRSRQSILIDITKPNLTKQDSFVRKTSSVEKNTKIFNKLDVQKKNKLAMTFQNHRTSPDKEPIKRQQFYNKKRNNILKMIKTSSKKEIFRNQKIVKTQVNKEQNLLKRCQQLILIVKNFIHDSVKFTKILNENQKSRNLTKQFISQKNCLQQFIEETQHQLQSLKASIRLYQQIPNTLSSKLIFNKSGQYSKDINDSRILISSDIENKSIINKEKLYQKFKNEQLQLIKLYIKKKMEPNEYNLFNKILDQTQKQYKLKLILQQPITKEKQIQINQMIKFTRTELNQLLLQNPAQNIQINYCKNVLHQQQRQVIQDKLKQILTYLKVSVNQSKTTSCMYLLELIELKLYNLKIDLIPVLRKTNEYLQKQNKSLRNDVECKTIQFNKLFQIKNQLQSEIQSLNSVKINNINCLQFYQTLLVLYQQQKNKQENSKLKTQEKTKISKQIIRYRRKVNSMEDVIPKVSYQQNKSISTQVKFDQIIQFFKRLIKRSTQQHIKLSWLEQEYRQFKQKYIALQQNLKIIYNHKESKSQQLQNLISYQQKSREECERLKYQLISINTEKQQIQIKLTESNMKLQMIQTKVMQICKILNNIDQNIQQLDQQLMQSIIDKVTKNKQQNIVIKLQLIQKNKIIEMKNSIIMAHTQQTQDMMSQNIYKFNLFTQHINQILSLKQTLEQEGDALKSKLKKYEQANQESQQIMKQKNKKLDSQEKLIKQMKQDSNIKQKKIQQLQNIINKLNEQFYKKTKQYEQQKDTLQTKYKSLEQMYTILFEDNKKYFNLTTQLQTIKTLLQLKQTLIQGMAHQITDYHQLCTQHQKLKASYFQYQEIAKSQKLQYQHKCKKLFTDIINENLNIQHMNQSQRYLGIQSQCNKQYQKINNQKMNQLVKKAEKIKDLISGYKLEIKKLIEQKQEMLKQQQKTEKKFVQQLSEYNLLNSKLKQKIQNLNVQIKLKQDNIHLFQQKIKQIAIINRDDKNQQIQFLINQNKLLKETYQRQFKANLIIINKQDQQIKTHQHSKYVCLTNSSFSSSFCQSLSISTQTQQNQLQCKIQKVDVSIKKIKELQNEILVDFNKNRGIMNDIIMNLVTTFQKFNFKFQDLINILIKKFKITIPSNNTDAILDILIKSITQLDLKQYQYYEVLQKLIDQFLFNKVNINFQQQMKQLSPQNKQKITKYRKKIGDIQSTITIKNQPNPKLHELNKQIIFYKNELNSKEKQIKYLQSELDQKNILLSEKQNNYNVHQSLLLKEKENTLFEIYEISKEFNHQQALNSLLDESAICNNDQLEFAKSQLSKCLKQNGVLKQKIKKIQGQYLDGYKFLVQSLNELKADIDPKTEEIYSIYTRLNQTMKSFRTFVK